MTPNILKKNRYISYLQITERNAVRPKPVNAVYIAITKSIQNRSTYDLSHQQKGQLLGEYIFRGVNFSDLVDILYLILLLVNL